VIDYVDSSSSSSSSSTSSSSSSSSCSSFEKQPILKFFDFGLAVFEKHENVLRGTSLWTVFINLFVLFYVTNFILIINSY
jgi:hypothetical protein